MLQRHMLGHYLYRPIRRLRHLGNFHWSAPGSAPASYVRAAKAEKLEAPVPGTVKQYEQHVMIQAAPLKSDRAAQQCHSAHGIWWPSAVEKYLHIQLLDICAPRTYGRYQVASAGVVKVTAFEEPSRDTFLEAGKPVCDVRIYPAGVEYTNLPIDKVRQVTLAHMDSSSTAEGSDNDDDLDSPSQVDPLLDLQRPLSGVQLYICCHGSRDTRCGKLGNSLVAVMEDLIRQHQLQNLMQVYKCSHVGGHKYAGNVLVYGAMSPCDGDWFGGINERNAAAFLEGIINAEVGSEGGAQEAALRPYWRGRMGTSKQEQLDLFEGRLPSDEDFSDTDQEEQGSTHQQRVITAAHDFSAQPSRSFSSWQSHESVDAAPEQASSQCSCQTQEVTVSNNPPGDGERNPVDPKQDSSSSGEDSSSSSESESNSSSEDDPDDVQPIQITKTV